jgi:hypothetical protein
MVWLDSKDTDMLPRYEVTFEPIVKSRKLSRCEPQGDEFDEDGDPHQKMVLRLQVT